MWITCGQTVDKSRPNQPQGGFSYFCWWVFHRLLTGFPQVFHRPKPSSQAARIVPRGARRPERRAEAGAPSQPRRSQEACQLPSGGRSAARRPERQQEACQESSIARSVPTVGAARSVPRAEAPQVSCQRCTTAAVRRKRGWHGPCRGPRKTAATALDGAALALLRETKISPVVEKAGRT